MVVRTSPSTTMSRAVAAGDCESFTVTETTASPALDMTSDVDASTGGAGTDTTGASNIGSMLHMLLQSINSTTATPRSHRRREERETYWFLSFSLSLVRSSGRLSLTYFSAMNGY